ncbi:M23 family metallopeptidase [Halobacillus yeomjeoni]|uniref:M23 family metallopeptidase n=1 Tax=Halobacillus yeomjeoni TaxID=311194 RepID=A0A931HXY7_9BACI|nr:M23 family metallopeptidase [Halobacillus yeomjeoni]MBH0231311.1 M23 family metallopeptidase [Halobacillus yeomjeoni]
MNEEQSDPTLAIGGSKVETEFGNSLPEDIASNEEIAELKTIQRTIPELVQQYEKTIEELEGVQEELASLPSIWPTEARRITSGFGNRTHPVTKETSLHAGLDIAGPYRSEIYATADGRVTFAGNHGTYGNFIRINHPNEYQSQYGHMTELLDDYGQEVKKR